MEGEAVIAEIQTLLGVKADSIWGPRSQAALISADRKTKKKVQAILGVVADGDWGPISQAAINVAAGQTDEFVREASSFADPADVAAFKKCKRDGGYWSKGVWHAGSSDMNCFGGGDNGIGQFGKITAQDHVAMVAVHKTDMLARWGSIEGAAHRPVVVTANGRTIHATVEDRVSAKGRIDLNPGCAKLLGLTPPFLVSARWRWA